ncbi:Clavaminate synthase-like protein [Aaosphaeria arxii CBS 175.79]|uniref:Clavaminate synthase-like protein n=1 Tax=Aaosphaeria arxii CBS 175.79 TaxID=1450172 RepID=A0A6A5XEF7_9PLEO|nr:Clavaminate synthase-like protein [Aaosphaeria arxii CBS 175.79]KAF2011585.1 Clavaminate synthase-like protein [Aaosphaeria arxii CBS 175.79]
MGSIPAPQVFAEAEYKPTVFLPSPYPKGTVFPFTLAPVQSKTPLHDVIAEIQDLSKTGKIRSLLNTHGAIFFKDLKIENAEQFSQFAHSFGYVPHEDIGNPVRRTILAKNVATANEGPNTQPVYPHNEFGLSPHFPAYVFFYCFSAPDTGGETPINNSIILYQQLKEKHPEFIKEIEEKGVKYQLFYVNSSRDQTTSPGNSVLQAYGEHVNDTDDTETARQKIEKEIQRLPTARWIWENQSESNPLGDLRVWQHLPAVRKHPHTGQTTFFNNTVSRFLNAIDAETLQPPHINKDGRYQPPAFYGDDSLIPREYYDTAVEIIKSTRSLVTWNKGDVILLDNHAVQHAREPWTGERKLLASLWDEP